MKLRVFVRRFLMPSPITTLIAFFRFRAFVSMKSEVDLSDRLSLGRNVRISSFAKVKASNGALKIGNRTSVATGCFISAGEKGTFVGDDCLIGPNCTIISNTYRYSRLDQTFEEQGDESKGTHIGNNVQLGAGVVVVDGATIGNGVIVGANSVVSGRIPDHAVAQGNPAKVIFIRR